MSRIAWYKRDPAAALLGMEMLTLEECGAYNLILDMIYERANELADDDRFIAGRLKVDLRVWRRIKKRLVQLGKLYIDAGYIRNKTADAVVAECLARTEHSRNAALTKHAKSRTELNCNNELASASAYAGAPAKVLPYKKIESDIDSESHTNSESTEPKKETDTSPHAPIGANGKMYVFEGKIFRLNSKDFEQWKKAYSHIDLMAELFDLDNYFDRELKGGDRKKIFHRMSGAVRKRNQRAMDESNANPCTPGKYKKLELF